MILFFGSQCKSIPVKLQRLQHTVIQFNGDTTGPNSQCTGSRLDGNLQALARRHLVKCLLEVGKLEHVCNHTLGLDLATVEVLHRAGEAVGLRERADNLMCVCRDKYLMGRFTYGDKLTVISSPKIFEGGQWTRALFSYTP
jgi:hypothetical protein